MLLSLNSNRNPEVVLVMLMVPDITVNRAPGFAKTTRLGLCGVVAAAAMDCFSFAQVREAYILAGQFAFDRGDDVTPDDLVQAANQIRREGRRLSVSPDGHGVGFSNQDDRAEESGIQAVARG